MRLKTYRTPARRRADRAVTVLLVVALVAAVAWLLAPEARAGELYRLAPDGIHLAEPLVDGDHLNVRRSDGVTVNIHVEAKCADRDDAECAGKPGRDARWLGATLIPWSAFGVDGEVCAVWVQHARTGYHYGEQGEPPYCPGAPEPDPTPDPEPSPSPSPTPDPDPTPTPEPDPTPDPDPSPDPTPDPEPTPDPTPTPEPEPTPTPAPSPEPECPGIPDECDDGDQWPEPTPEPPPSPAPTPTPSPSAPAPDDDELECPEGKAPGWLDENGDPTSCVDDDPTPWPDPIPDEAPDDPTPEPAPDLPELPETGLAVGALGVIALVLVAVGGLTHAVHRRVR